MRSHLACITINITQKILAPNNEATFEDATKLIVGIITTSPFFISNALIAIYNAVVPLEHAKTYLVLKYFLESFSNSSTKGLVVINSI